MCSQKQKIALLVEDELFIVLELEEMLRTLGYVDIATSSSVAAARSSLAASTPDLAIVDYRLGDYTAETLIGDLAAAMVPTVIYSGYCLDPEIDRSMPDGFEWVSKPADAKTLSVAIARACSLRLG